jgi:ribosomal protein S18 acetylase RimI-like enzyme
MIIRKYQTDDFEQLAAIYNVAHPDEFYCEEGKFSFVPWAEDEYIMSILNNSDVYICEAESILGFCGYLDNKLNWMFVDPKARGKGIAAKLLAHVLPKLQHDIFLFVLKSNVRAIALYEKFGFILHKEFLVDFQGHPILLNKMVSQNFRI